MIDVPITRSRARGVGLVALLGGAGSQVVALAGPLPPAPAGSWIAAGISYVGAVMLLVAPLWFAIPPVTDPHVLALEGDERKTVVKRCQHRAFWDRRAWACGVVAGVASIGLALAWALLFKVPVTPWLAPMGGVGLVVGHGAVSTWLAQLQFISHVGRCPMCEYDLRGSESSECPECGHVRRSDFRHDAIAVE